MDVERIKLEIGNATVERNEGVDLSGNQTIINFGNALLDLDARLKKQESELSTGS